MTLSLDRLRGPLVALVSLAAGAGIWEWLGTQIPKTEFVGFWATLKALGHLIGNGELGSALAESMEVFGIGLAIGARFLDTLVSLVEEPAGLVT